MNEETKTKTLDTHVLARPTRDIRQRPRRLELQSGIVVPAQKLHETRYDARVDDLLYGRILLYRQESAELRRAFRLEGGIAPHHPLDHLGEVFELVRAAHAGRGAGGRTAHVHAGDGACASSEGSVMQERRGMRIDGIQRGDMTRVE